jgi:hypothetical protein
MDTLTQFLENIMVSTLLGLPREIKELIYFDALSHAANKILVCVPPPFSCLSATCTTTNEPRPCRSPPT